MMRDLCYSFLGTAARESTPKTCFLGRRRTAHYFARNTIRRDAMPVILSCRTCGNPCKIDPYLKDTALYCSNLCRGKGLIKPEIMIPCEQCGQPFVAKRDWRFCSTPCRRQSQSATNMRKSLESFWSRVKQCGHEW